IANLPVVGVGPEMRSVTRIDQLHGHLQPVCDLLLAAFEQVVDAEFMSNLPGVSRLVAVLEARVSGDDGISLAPRKLGDDPLGDGVAEISLIRASTHVVQREDRNPRHFSRRGRRGALEAYDA